MDRLPDELIPMLFEHLELEELLNCRLVCKRFKYFVDRTKIKELVVASSRPADLKKSRFLTKETIDIEKNAISPNAFNGYRFVFGLNRHLKCLCLSFDGDLTLNMSFLNQMQIEQLDVKCRNLEMNQAVELPLLKNLELMVTETDELYYDFFVRAPKLVKMKTNCLENVHLNSPDTLLYLETDCRQEQWRRFKNLQVLRVCYLYRDVLADFGALKSFEIHNPMLVETSLADHRDTLKYLVKQAKVLKRPDFKLFFCGVPIVDGLELDGSPQPLDLQVRNFDRLAGDLSLVTEIDYTQLTAAIVSNGLSKRPSSFLTIFYNVQKVSTSGRVNRKHFTEFLKQATYLTDLELVNSSLSTSIASLPKFCNLTRLKVHENQYIPMNFDFILKFKRLRFFEAYVYCEDSFFSLAIVSFEKLAELDEFSFKISEKTIEIMKHDRQRYSFHCGQPGMIRTYEYDLTFAKLVELCIKTKYGKLTNSFWASEIRSLAIFYKSGAN